MINSIFLANLQSFEILLIEFLYFFKMWSLGYTQVPDKDAQPQEEHPQVSTTTTESTLHMSQSQSSRLVVKLDAKITLSESTSPLIDAAASPDSTTPTTESSNFFADDFNYSSGEALPDEATDSTSNMMSSPEPAGSSTTTEKSDQRPTFFTDADEENESKLESSRNEDPNDSTVIISEPRPDSSSSEIEDDFVMIEPTDRFPESSHIKSNLKPGKFIWPTLFSLFTIDFFLHKKHILLN
jgi:hypothetical protein